MMLPLVSRRGMIAAGLGAALAIGGRCRADAAGPAALIAVCSGLPPAASLGRACLRALPAGERSPRRLAGLLLDGLPARRTRLSVRRLREALRERSREDFRDDRVVSVGGWMLSLTETRLYALASLAANRPRHVG